MKKSNRHYFFTLLSGIFLTASAHAQWKMVDGPLSTTWAEKINPDRVLPEYPRPMMQRDLWINLNGTWEFQPASLSDNLPTGKKLSGSILVPFAWESALSGIRQQMPDQRAWYKREFTVPKKWASQKTLMHFGAVDWEATVYINGKFALNHKGGFDEFSVDITPFLVEGEKQEVIVNVYDPGSDEGIAYGKQSNQRFKEPMRYNYAPSSGIWQTVWLESVPNIYITQFQAVPKIDTQQLSVKVNINTHAGDDFKFKAIAKSNGKVIAETIGDVIGLPVDMKIENPRLWWPQDPFLYDLEIQLLNKEGKSVDKIDGYFGMRKIALGDYHRNNVGSVKRIMLNNTFIFQMGPLDQGYWPDGLYTAPSDEALRWEIEQMKAWGFNMVRKHIKVEPQRWFYWADKLGILVWQDMPSTFKKMSTEEKIQFENELQQLIKSHLNHPSIINWIVFNEHWGAYDVERITKSVMELDPSRLVTGNSGIDASDPDIDYEVGHIKDNHHYRAPAASHATTTRAVVNGEFGAIGYKVKGHLWDVDGPWVHDSYEKETFEASKEAATVEYEKFMTDLVKFKAKELLSGAVYTQLTDVENEVNGLYTYDRKIEKLDKQRVKAANESLWIKDFSAPTKTKREVINNADAGPESITP